MDFLTRSIPRRTLAALLSIYVVTYIATALVVYSSVRSSLRESEVTALDQLAELKYEQLANIFGALATDLRAWSELDIMNDLVSGDIDKRIAKALEADQRLYGLPGNIYAFDAGGKLLASSEGAVPPRMDGRLPTGWRTQRTGLVLLDQVVDPATGAAAVAFETPVFGSFDKTYRIGTLVMTYPWTSIEKLLFSGEAGMALVDRSDPERILAGSHIGTRENVVMGRSAANRPELLKNWQIVASRNTGIGARSLRQVILELILLGLFLAVPIVALGRWLSNRLTAPIAALTRAVTEIAKTDKLHARVPVSSSDELGLLARSFNVMTSKLEKTTHEREEFVRDLAALNQTLENKIALRTEELRLAMQAQQRLIADISHEIKSPLARLSMALGLARRTSERAIPKQYDRMETEIANISALASELLTLARLEGSAAAPDFTEINIGALIAQIVADARFERPSRKSDVVFQVPETPIAVIGNADLLRRAIENVVRNAIFYTTEGTSVKIALWREPAEMVCVQVSDEGLGVPEDAISHLFEPFYRVDEARARETGGTGIGLSICERVVRFHRGSVCAKNGEPHGLIIEIRLPVQDALLRNGIAHEHASASSPVDIS